MSHQILIKTSCPPSHIPNNNLSIWIAGPALATPMETWYVENPIITNIQWTNYHGNYHIKAITHLYEYGYYSEPLVCKQNACWHIKEVMMPQKMPPNLFLLSVTHLFRSTTPCLCFTSTICWMLPCRRYIETVAIAHPDRKCNWKWSHNHRHSDGKAKNNWWLTVHKNKQHSYRSVSVPEWVQIEHSKRI